MILCPIVSGYVGYLQPKWQIEWRKIVYIAQEALLTCYNISSVKSYFA